MEYLDAYICDQWNETHLQNKIADENAWEFCRLLMGAELLEANKSAVSTMAIGPFRIASTMKIKHNDVYEFLLEIVFPLVFSASNTLTFSQSCELYLIPAAKFILAFLDNSHIIQNPLHWEIILYIKAENALNKYPTLSDIEKNEKFKGYNRNQLNEALISLKKHPNLIKDSCSLIDTDMEGRIKSNI